MQNKMFQRKKNLKKKKKKKNGIAQGQNVNWLEPTRFKMDDSASTCPWASFYAHCNAHQLISMLNDTPQALWGQKVAGGPIPGNPHPFPK